MNVFVATQYADSPKEAKQYFRNKAKYRYQDRGLKGARIHKIIRKAKGVYEVEFTKKKKPARQTGYGFNFKLPKFNLGI